MTSLRTVFFIRIFVWQTLFFNFFNAKWTKKWKKHTTKQRKNLTAKEIKRLVDKLQDGETPTEIATEFGVTKACVYKYKKNLSETAKKVANVTTNQNRKSMKGPKYDLLDEALRVWFLQMRRQHIPVSLLMIQRKSLQLFGKIYPSGSFKGSKGYAFRFLSRNDFRPRKICGEKVSSNFDAAIKFKQQFRELIQKEGLKPEQKIMLGYFLR